MNKIAIIKQLVDLANDFDAKGLTKEADEIDALIKEAIAVPTFNAPSPLQPGPRKQTVPQPKNLAGLSAEKDRIKQMIKNNPSDPAISGALDKLLEVVSKVSVEEGEEGKELYVNVLNSRFG